MNFIKKCCISDFALDSVSMAIHLEEAFPGGSTIDCNTGIQSGKGKKRNSYDMIMKLEAVTFSELNGKRAAARKFGVEVKRIREWCSKKAELTYKASTADGQKRKRLDGAGRKPLSEKLENVILGWFYEKKERKEHISIKAIGKQAELAWQSFNKPNDAKGSDPFVFKASSGWVTSFMKRHGLSLK